ncbi:MAG: hypothetical protein MJA82_12520 [Clostridia bacterium]|nr:hypothetical protein [Clostridia bacterium]
MKILFVSMFPIESNTSATIQNKGIIKGIINNGHIVDILTVKPNINTQSYDDSMNDIHTLLGKTYYIELNSKYKLFMAKKDNKSKNILNENTGLLRLGLKCIKSFVKKLYYNIAIYDAQKFNVKQVSKLKIDYCKYDIIVSSSDPKSSHLIVERIYKENQNCRAKWIQYWGDPMFHDITRKKDWRDELVKYSEKKLISKADKVFYASPLTLQQQRETFVDLSFKMDYASQTYVDEITHKTKKNQTKSSQKEVVVVGYFGAYRSGIRNIIPLYNAAKGGNFNLTICGPSDILLQSTKNVTVYGSVPYKKSLKMEEESDIIVCICNSRGTQIPGKIYYCSSYKKPMIVVLDGEYQEELRNYFNSFDRYIVCENHEKSINSAIRKAKEKLNNYQYNINERLTPEYMGRKILSDFLKLGGN